MNDQDSDKMAGLLESAGFVQGDEAEADIIVLNTCSIREKAEHKVHSAIGRFKALKVAKPELVTVVAGCVAQQEKTRLLKRSPEVDAVLGTHQIARLPQVVKEILEERRRSIHVELIHDVQSLHIPARTDQGRICSFVSIMQGCSNFCSYCVVPHTRGPEQSRPTEEIIAEAQALVSSGVREVTLLGQNVNSYGKDLAGDDSFVDLLTRLDAVRGLSRIRFTTSHPRDFGPDTADAVSRLAKVCEHVHLPVQSGSTRILAAMNRGYTREDYLGKIHDLRSKIPHVALTTDIIVGFPGETEEDFQETLSLLAEVRYDQIFSFKYSRRPQTEARNYTDQIPERVRKERLLAVHTLQDAITQDYARGMIGKKEEVLVEGFRSHTRQAFGRTRSNKIVNFAPTLETEAGMLLFVRITDALKHTFLGEVAD